MCRYTGDLREDLRDVTIGLFALAVPHEHIAEVRPTPCLLHVTLAIGCFARRRRRVALPRDQQSPP
jgi:hypothetical protein